MIDFICCAGSSSDYLWIYLDIQWMGVSNNLLPNFNEKIELPSVLRQRTNSNSKHF